MEQNAYKVNVNKSHICSKNFRVTVLYHKEENTSGKL